MIAIISDIHSNLEALEAVLEDIDKRGIKEIVCLGDMVGYGAKPRECVDLVQRHVGIGLLGNHDKALLTKGTEGFNLRAETALMWTRDEFFTGAQRQEDRQRRHRYLKSLPLQHENGSATFVHGSLRMPLKDYVFPRDIRLKSKMREIFEKFSDFCFCGHTHIPGIFSPSGTYTHPEDLLGGVFMLEEPKALVNVGSVGQPRDSDRRACYCTFDGDSLVFKRIKYDVQKAAQRIFDAEGLDNSLAERLLAGK